MQVDQQDAVNVLEYLNSVGTLGLAFIVFMLVTGRFVTKREFDREIDRCDKLDQRLQRALLIGDRAIEAGDKLAERLPEKS